VPHGGPATAPTINPIRTDFTFAGWFTEAVGGVSFDFSTPITADTVVHARWTANVINQPPGGGSGGGTWVSSPQRRPAAPPPTRELHSDGSHHAFLIGFEDGTIRPHAQVTRAQVATIFFRIMSDSDRAHYWMQTNPFPDVSLDQWFNNAISTTTNAGIFVGMPDGTFQPSRAVTRAELAATIVRYMGASTAETTPQFNDIAGHWAEEYINAAAAQGWIVGYEGLGGRFLPNQPITRAETAAIINRMLERLPEHSGDLLDNMRTWPDNASTSAWYYLYIQEATNSHYYVMKSDGIHEAWVELIRPERPWQRLELPTSGPGDIFRVIE